MKNLLSISILLLLCLTSCTDDKAVLTILDRAEAMMGEHSDSAYLWLCKADSAIADQSKKTQMRHLMLKAEATNKLFLQMPSDTLFQEVVDYYDRHGTSNQQLKAHYLLGCIYRDMKEAPQAIQCYYDAVEKADTLSDDCDYNTLFRVYSQMSFILDSQIMPDEEIDALKKFGKYALKAGYVYEYIRSIEFMSKAYNLKADTAMVLSTEQRAHDLYLKHDMPKAAASACMLSMYIYINLGDYIKVKHLMDVLENESGLFNKRGEIEPGREHYYHCKGLYYLGINQLDSAEYYFKKLLHHGYSFDAYRGLMEVAQRKGDSQSVLSYSKCYEASFDTLVTNIHEEATRQVVGMYNYSRQQKIAEKEREVASKNRALLIVSVFMFVLIFIVVYGMYRRFRTKKLREVARLNSNLAIVKQNYTKVLAEWQSKEKSFSNQVSEKQNELERLSQQLQEYQQLYDQISPSDKEDALMHSDIVMTFRDMTKPRRTPIYPSQSDWDYLLANVERCLPSFYSEIARASLSKQELQVTLLTRLNFSPADMAILLNTKVGSSPNCVGFVM